MPVLDAAKPLKLPRAPFPRGRVGATRLILAKDWSGHPLGESAG